ncbi:MAG: hypothetical protein HC893_07430, partial [Chloroflexaceae bacterium]|nr:hypothetical protein [Chloroflexaceae bacterium]
RPQPVTRPQALTPTAAGTATATPRSDDDDDDDDDDDGGLSVNFTLGAPGSIFVLTAPNLPDGSQARIAVRGPNDTDFADLFTLTVPNGGTLVFIIVTPLDAEPGAYTIRLTIDTDQTSLSQIIERETTITIAPDAPRREEVVVDVPEVPLEPVQAERRIYLPLIVR